MSEMEAKDLLYRREILWFDHETTGYTIDVVVPEDVWRQGSGHPGFVKWAVYEIEGRELIDGEPGPPLYWEKGAVSNFSVTADLAKAESRAEGSVKWDGCSNFSVGEEVLMHVCDADDLALFCKALERAYALSLEMVGGGLT